MMNRRATVAAVLAVTAVTVSACSVTDSETATAIETFTPEAVTWGNCESAFAATYPAVPAVDRLECASVSVPADYRDLGGPSIELAISRLPAASEHSRGTLIVNPGGPGIEGRSMPALIGDTAGMSEWDIIGVDVRGTGASPRPSCTARYLLSTLVTCGGGSSASVWLLCRGRKARLLECCRRSRGRRITADRGVAE